MKNKKLVVILLVIGIISIMMGVSIAFFNYTRTGSANTLAVGRIYFTSSQGNAINLTNVKPVKSTEIENNPNVGSVTINVQGDTTYANGIEYLISAKDVVNTVNNKKIPISVSITVNNIGTSDDDYFTNRGGNTSIYKNVSDNKLKEEKQLIVGYIKSGATGINGSVTIKAYIDADKIAISDTYDGTESDNMNTKEEWVDGRTVLTTTEWNSLITGGVSFKVKVEANEGVWVDEELNPYKIMQKNADTVTQINFANISSNTNGEGIYRLSGTESDTYPIYYYRGAINNNNVVFGGFCWQMVRTTETGGVKMIYNGEPEISGSGEDITYNCLSTRNIPNYSLTKTDLNINMGFYYADGYEIVSTSGNSVTYRLKSRNNPITNVVITDASEAATNIPVIATNYPYTCKGTSSTATCTVLYKVDSYASGTNANVYSTLDRILIGSSKFYTVNTAQDIMSDVGYMYNKKYVPESVGVSGRIYGKDVEWNGTNYLLIEDTAHVASTNTTLNNNHHYTCYTSGLSSCSFVLYYYATNRFIRLTDGEKIEDAIYKMTGNGTQEVKARNSNYNLNENDSVIKSVIDNWFRTNLTNEVNSNNPDYKMYIEDTVYCNDRTFKTVEGNTSYPVSSSGWNPNGGNLTGSLYFGTLDRSYNNWYSTTNVPSTSCSNETDRFTVSNLYGNGSLTYPVGLLTADEIVMAGTAGNNSNSNLTYYLNIGDTRYWTMTPHTFNYYNSLLFVNNSGDFTTGDAKNSYGVRPVISLKHDIEFERGGDGTGTNPYVVKYN